MTMLEVSTLSCLRKYPSQFSADKDLKIAGPFLLHLYSRRAQLPICQWFLNFLKFFF